MLLLEYIFQIIQHEFLTPTPTYRHQAREVVEKYRYRASFHTRSRDVMCRLPRCPVMKSKWCHDSRISLECLECKKYLTRWHVIRQWKKVDSYIFVNFSHQFMSILQGRCVKKPGQAEPVGCYENSFISNLGQLCK